MGLTGAKRFLSWCVGHALLLVAAAAYIAGLCVAAAAFAMPWMSGALAAAALGSIFAAFALASRWIRPIALETISRSGSGGLQMFGGRLVGTIALLSGGTLSAIGAAVRLGEPGAAGLGIALLGLMLVLLSEPVRETSGSPTRSLDPIHAPPGIPPPPPTD